MDGDSSDFTSLLLEGSYTSWSEISRDSRRTYALILRKRPLLHLQLTRVLHALATRFKDIGYCQGMNFVAGTILLQITSIEDPGVLIVPPAETSDEEQAELPSPSNAGRRASNPDTFMAVIHSSTTSPAEVTAFKVCERLFVRNHFIRMYELGLHTRLTIWTFDKLVESLFPDLHEMITHELQVSADFYASSWFITLFCADLDFPSSVRIMDLFVAKGPKALHRFGLACLASEQSSLLESQETLRDPAEGLKQLRTVAVAAVSRHGIEAMIHRSFTEFKCVTNRLIADLQTTGKVHGGAQLMFVTNQDSARKSWIVVPMPSEFNADNGGDSSPSGAAFEAAWNKEEASIRLGTIAGPEHKEGRSKRMNKIFSRIKIRRTSNSVPASVQPPVMVVDDMGYRSDSGVDDDADGVVGLTGRGNSVSPEGKKSSSSSKSKASKAFKSFKKRLVSIMPSSHSKGYSKSGDVGGGSDE